MDILMQLSATDEMQMDMADFLTTPFAHPK
jgi:hypothetical protein